MGGSNVVVYVIVGFLSVAAAALAFAAEATKIKVSDIADVGTRCIYPETSANILGYTAAVLVIISQITISVVSRCACCQRNTSNSTTPTGAIICFVICWVASVIGVILLASAANLSTRHEYLDNVGLCYTVKPGIFATGGGLALVAGLLGLFAYNLTAKYDQQQPTAAAGIPYNQNGIAMGNPQFNNAAAHSNPYPKQQQYV